MKKDKAYYRQLMRRYLDNACTPQEIEELLNYVGEDISNRMILEEMQAGHESSLLEKDPPETLQWSDRVREQLLENIHAVPVIPVYKRKLFVAAAVFIVFAAGSFFYFNAGRKTVIPDAVSERKEKIIVPGGDRATLTLADGTVIDLNGTESGDITLQGDVKVIKAGGALNYTVTGNGSNVPVYNTITTPRGGQYMVVLADGSKVWLNAASSLRFPTSFNGVDRSVELTGEGYFEIAKHTSHDGVKQPFYVAINAGRGGVVEVLGTQFNIMAYDEEGEINTTLLEGSVQLNMEKRNVLLQPGQQAHVTKAGQQIEVLPGVDIENIVAWKNGEFRFDNTDVRTIMRQIERWYDITIIYDANIPDTRLSGKIRRKNNIEQLLEILEATHKVQFRIEGKNVIVAPYVKQ